MADDTPVVTIAAEQIGTFEEFLAGAAQVPAGKASRAETVPVVLPTPVVPALDEERIKSFGEYVDAVRSSNTGAARTEAVRLRSYFSALAQVTTADTKATQEDTADVSALIRRGNLTRLFNTVAERTRNTILSEIIIAPIDLLSKSVATENATQFNAELNYGGKKFIFGFLQVFNDKKTAGTSIPLLSFDTALMESMAPFGTEKLFKAMQAVATAGNHDMLHHYTNTVLNNSIAAARLDSSLAKPVVSANSWFSHYFKYNRDSDINSYESWLMLDHMRIRRQMEEGPEGKALAQACDTFFDELDRIGREMTDVTSAGEAHKAIDYLGTMLLFAMMRYMPLNHPLVEHAIERLQQADPDPALLAEGAKERIVKRITDDVDTGEPYVEATLDNYKAKGLDLRPADPDYATLKRLQLIIIAPWVVHLLSPAKPDSDLAKMQGQERVGSANMDMIRDSAAGVWFNMKNGAHLVVKPDGSKMEIHLSRGRFDRKDGPAVVEISADGKKRTESWYRKGRLQLSHSLTVTKDGALTEEWKHEGWLHRVDGPALLKISADGAREEEWHLNGHRHREGGPAVLRTAADGTVTFEAWWKNDKRHREDGIAKFELLKDGGRQEEWYLDGERHRIGGPANLKTKGDGTVLIETWWKNGKRHRDDGGPARMEIDERNIKAEDWYIEGKRHRLDGPAAVETRPDGTVRLDSWWKDDKRYREGGGGPTRTENWQNGSSKEEWYVDDRYHRLDGPALTTINENGIKEEYWYIGGKRHRDDGPAVVETRADGTVRLESWWKNDVRHREEGPARIETWQDGSSKEEWYVNGKYHRLDGPALIKVTADGTREETWYKEGRYHRADGPAYTKTMADGTVLQEVWWKDGSKIDTPSKTPGKAPMPSTKRAPVPA